MKIIFFGTPKFAADILDHLIKKKFNIVASVTPPDKKKGRGKKIKFCATKEVAIKNNVPVLQPKNLSCTTFTKKLKEFNADLFVVVAFRILPKIIWSMPKKNTINLHTSLLPKYKGAAPINWVLINGEFETGITTFFLNEKIDSGKIILQEKISLTQNTTAAELHEILVVNGKDMLVKTLEKIKHNKLPSNTKNNNVSDIKAPKISKEICKIDWSQSAQNIHNLVRGLSPLMNQNTILNNVSICPSAWFIIEDENLKRKRIKLLLTELVKHKSNKKLSLETDNKSFLQINKLDGVLSIKYLQLEGKKPMSIKDFLSGFKINDKCKII